MRNPLASFALAAAVCASVVGMASAQSGARITLPDLVGQWRLVVTPIEREGMDIQVEGEDGGPMDLALTVRTAGSDRLVCTLRDRPADCRLSRERFEVTQASRSGGARMTFTLDQRTASGFAGSASVRVRLLPFVGGRIGTVLMTRR